MMQLHSTLIQKLFSSMLFFPILANASIVNYVGTGVINSVPIEGVPVDPTQDLSYSFSIDDTAIDMSTDAGRGEYLTGTLQASVEVLTSLVRA